MTAGTTLPPDLSRLRAALAADSYVHKKVRIADADISGFDWLVTTSKGLLAVRPDGYKTAVYGWFFGICRHQDWLFLFENCGHKDRIMPRGRLLRFRLSEGHLSDATVMATGLNNRCHQIAVIDGLLHVLDTANQAILRFDLDGSEIDSVRPFATPSANNAADYHHINAIAQVGDRIAIMLHNGALAGATISEVAWFDKAWRQIERTPMPGLGCHDIVTDDQGTIWHSDSMVGHIISAAGHRIPVNPELMTRGIAFGAGQMIVGLSIFGPRDKRGSLPGTVAIYDRRIEKIAEVVLCGAPADIVSLR